MEDFADFIRSLVHELDTTLNPVHDVRITVASITVSASTQVNLLATPVDANGVATPDTNPITFSADNAGGATLNDNGNGTCSVVPTSGTTNVMASDGVVVSSTPFTIIVQPSGAPGAVADIIISQV